MAVVFGEVGETLGDTAEAFEVGVSFGHLGGRLACDTKSMEGNGDMYVEYR